MIAVIGPMPQPHQNPADWIAFVLLEEFRPYRRELGVEFGDVFTHRREGDLGGRGDLGRLGQSRQQGLDFRRALVERFHESHHLCWSPRGAQDVVV